MDTVVAWYSGCMDTVVTWIQWLHGYSGCMGTAVAILFTKMGTLVAVTPPLPLLTKAAAG